MLKIKSQPSSVLALILVNLYPVFGVLFLGWDVFPIMLLFWSENVIIGFYNVLRMIACKPEETEPWIHKVFMIPFFIVHYGGFTAAHGVFVVILFGRGVLGPTNTFSLNMLWELAREQYILYAILALFFSHGYSFVTNYLRKGEYRNYSLSKLMSLPYGRVVLMHLTLVIGAFLIIALRTRTAGLMLFILMKILMDLWAHLKEHRTPV
ncbi:MAG: DUF6498-containing protein [bacterium]